MPGYLNNDGSELVGALTPTGNGQALQLDASGNLKVTATGGAGSVVNVADPTTPANKMKINADGSINTQAALAAGSALIGGVQIVDTGGTNKLAIDAAGRVTLVPNSAINVAQIGGGALALGQNTMANSMPIAIASNQTAIATNIQVSGTALGTDNSNELKVSLYGKNAAAGDTAISVDSSGRPQINVAQWNGATPGGNNPMIMEDQVRFWINNGQAFTATTGKQTAAGAINSGVSVFNPNASGKTLIVIGLTYIIGNNNFNVLNLTTVDPTLGTALTVTNNKAGSATASIANATFTNTNVTSAGTTNMTLGSATNVFTQAFLNGNLLIIPPNNGFAFYANISGANSWAVSTMWIEQ